MKIISLLPSATEILCALGFEQDLVGRSHECDFPPRIKSLPALTAPAFPVEGSSREIDRQVQSLLAKGLSIYRVDAELLKKLDPDLIVTQTQCEVCAVSEAELQKALAGWVGHSSKILSLKPDSLSDIWQDFYRTAEALGVAERGRHLVDELKGRMGSVTARAQKIPDRPTVACIEWLDPLMAAGNWMPELVELAGGVNLFGEPGRHSPWLAWEELKQKDPEAMIVLPCGFDIARTESEMGRLEGLPGWGETRAVRSGRVYLSDGNQYFNRPGPRLVESLEILAEILHPGEFSFGWRGKGWKEFG